MKAHKYWSVGALITMLGTFYTGYKKQKSSHKYFALSSMLCMVMAIYTGHKMITGNRNIKSLFFLYNPIIYVFFHFDLATQNPVP